MTVATSIPPRLTPCKVNPSNFRGREATPAVISKQFYAVVRALDCLDPARGRDRRQPERL